MIHRIATQDLDAEVWLCEQSDCPHSAILDASDGRHALRRYADAVRADCTIVGWVEQGRAMVGITSTPPYEGAKGHGWAVPYDEWGFTPAQGKAAPSMHKQRAHALRAAEDHARAMRRR